MNNKKTKSTKKNKSSKSNKTTSKRRVTHKGGMPTYAELADLYNLNIGGKPYPEFNYKSVAGNIKVSNFVGGMLKKSYNNYKKGKQSNLRKHKKRSGGGVADNALTINASAIYDTRHLGIGDKSFGYPPITRIGRVPHSPMSLY